MNQSACITIYLHIMVTCSVFMPIDSLFLFYRFLGATAVESVMNEQFDNLEANSILLNAADDALDQNRSLLLPPYDNTTTIVEKVYPIHELLPQPLIKSLEDFIRYKFDSKTDFLSINLKLVDESPHNKPSFDFMDSLERYLNLITMEFKTCSNIHEHLKISSQALKHDKKAVKRHQKSLERLCVLSYYLKFYKIMTSNHFNTVKKTELVSLLSAPEAVVEHLTDRFSISRSFQGQRSFTATKTNM